jgi:hypothetical protein
MTHRPPTPPSVEAVAEAFDRLFIVDEDETFLLRSGTVSKAIAAYLGTSWSYPLGQVVRAVAEAAGARPARLCTSMYIRVRPRSMSREEALEQAKELRRAKQWQKVQQPAVLEAKAALEAARKKREGTDAP